MMRQHNPKLAPYIFTARVFGTSGERNAFQDGTGYLRFTEKWPFKAGGSIGGLVAEWLACWTQVQKGLGSNGSCDAVG